VLKQLQKLKYIGVLATGFDVIDVTAANKQNIVVTNIPTYGTDSVAQLVFALLLELCHRVGHHREFVKKVEWSSKRGSVLLGDAIDGAFWENDGDRRFRSNW